jgi:branched-chain amino acid transport system ATP-binding protein
MELLRIEKLSRDFGGVHAVHNVSFSVTEGEHLALIGPNGAGKTTLFNLLNGQLKPTSGHIFYKGLDITNLSTHQRIHLGIGRSFQIASLFNNLPVLENTVLAVQGTKPSRFQILRSITSNKEVFAKAEQLLRSMDLWERRNEPVNSIPYGAQRKLEIALSMASDPKLLLLDEPSCGLTVAESAEVTAKICNLEKNVTVICVAHDMDLVFGIASRIMVLHYGELIIEGSPEKIKDDPTVKKIYLGDEESV